MITRDEVRSSGTWKAGILLSRRYDWDGPNGWRLTVCYGFRRLSFTTGP